MCVCVCVYEWGREGGGECVLTDFSIATQVYQLEVKRKDPSLSPSILFRRYREFDEMHSKLLQCFPSEQLPPLPGKIFIPGKSHTRQVGHAVLRGKVSLVHTWHAALPVAWIRECYITLLGSGTLPY